MVLLLIIIMMRIAIMPRLHHMIMPRLHSITLQIPLHIQASMLGTSQHVAQYRKTHIAQLHMCHLVAPGVLVAHAPLRSLLPMHLQGQARGGGSGHLQEMSMHVHPMGNTQQAPRGAACRIVMAPLS